MTRGAPIVCTVDAETDWATDATRGIDEALPRLLELFDRHGASATFFVVGDVAERFAAHVRPASRHEVASHGLTHTSLTELSRAGVQHEVRESKRVLEALGFAVEGFRAPVLRRPADLTRMLLDAGYTYDSSGGGLTPRLRHLWPRRRDDGIRRVTTTTLRDRVTPFSLTWLRILDPLSRRMVSRRPAVFRCHLHELIDGAGAWRALPPGLRALHARRTGEPSWRILEDLLRRERPVITCRDWLRSVGAP